MDLNERIEKAFEESLNESVEFKNFAKLDKLLSKENGRIEDNIKLNIVIVADSAGGSEEYAIGNAEPVLKQILKSSGFKHYRIADSYAQEITSDDDEFEVTFELEFY